MRALLTMKKLLVLLICAALALAACSAPQEESFPAGDLTMVVPYSAGGTTDVVGRQLAVALSEALGVSVVVVNQPGASGAIGTQSVLDAAADGYTLLLSADSLGTQRVMGLSDMSYADFAPIMAVANDPKVIVAAADSPYTDLEALVEDMRTRPGRVRMSYTGPGGSGHVQSLIYNQLGLDMALTAYAGGGDCLLAVINGQVDFTNANLSTVIPYVDSGEVRLLAASAAERLDLYPEVPAITELLPEAEAYLTMPFTPLSLLVPADTPAEIQDILIAGAKRAVEDEEWLAFVRDNSLDELYLAYPDAEAARAFYSEWESLVSWLLYDAGAAPHSPEEFAIPRPQ